MSMTVSPKDRLILALDVENAAQAGSFADRLQGIVKTFKVGHQLFTSEGPGIVRTLQKNGAQVFLDLKYHDIPRTVASAGIAAARLGVRMFNVHALGGLEMMQRCREEVTAICAREGLTRPLVLAVTVLTSASEDALRRDLGTSHSLDATVLRLAQLAQEAGLDGVVASPREIPLIRPACGEHFLMVTPGVRPAWSARDDQERIATPSEAMKLGADYLVIGRPILRSPDPVEAAKRILAEMEAA